MLTEFQITIITNNHINRGNTYAKSIMLCQSKIQLTYSYCKGSQTFFATLIGYIFFATARILFGIPTCKLNYFFGISKKIIIMAEKMLILGKIMYKFYKIYGKVHKPSSLLSLDTSSSLLLESSLAFPPVN